LTKVEQLRELIARGSYEVDSDAVAAAILSRLLKRAEGTGDDARLA
jgi:anti-sigma28 factor (negative regulator of flagellin synthesis)